MGFGVACGDDTSSSSNDDGGSGGNTSASGGNGGTGGGSGGSGGSAPTCDGPGFAPEGVDTAMGVIEGTIQDVGGVAVNEILTDVCGTNQCLNGSAWWQRRLYHG